MVLMINKNNNNYNQKLMIYKMNQIEYNYNMNAYKNNIMIKIKRINKLLMIKMINYEIYNNKYNNKD